MNSRPEYGKLLIVDDPAALAREASGRLLRWAIEADAPARIALSGGSTPRQTYQALASRPFVDRFPWAKVHWFWGDERFVPPDHPDSNFRMAREAMLNVAPVPPANIHAIPTVGVDPDIAADQYEIELRRAYGGTQLEPGRPLFDVCLLGLGDDGHTASLIPGSPVLEERGRWVAPVIGGRPEVRITLTYPAINASRHIAFLVSGEEKRPILHEVRSGGSRAPAAQLAPWGDLVFIADRAAAGP
ncbi:MAG TPA: 6-phosphogluconolactonase [Stellaceae bacterium]|nr:6-phosphogluconolactonase [Stellaceae bacterium]